MKTKLFLIRRLFLLDHLNNYHYSLWPLLSFAVAFMGSFHCTVMCGGISVCCSQNLKRNILYQTGRLLGYLIMASIMYFIGRDILANYIDRFANFSFTFFALTIFLLGIKMLASHYKLRFNSFLTPFFAKLVNKKGGSSSFFIGLFTFLLPCGFLYAFLVSVLFAPSFGLSLLCVVFFWGGTLPSLVFTSEITHRFMKPLKVKYPIILPVFMILFGLYSLMQRGHIHLSDPHKSCHKVKN